MERLRYDSRHEVQRWPGWCAMTRALDPHVRKLAMKLPDVEEGTTFGYPTFKVHGKPFAWFPKKKEVEPGSLGVRMSFIERDHLVHARPDAFYVTPHYRDYPSVLVRVWLLEDVELRELLRSGHEYVVAHAKGARRKRRAGGS